jgi:hypothetical protein
MYPLIVPRQRNRDLPEGVFKRATRPRGDTVSASGASPTTANQNEGGSLIYRKVIPPELRPRLGRREWFVSLGTTDVVVARVKAVVESVLAERAFAEAREALLLDSASAELGQDHAVALGALAGALEAEQDSSRRAILGALLRRLASPAGEAPSGDQQTLTMLLDHWREAEQPSVPEYHVVGTAVDRFVKHMGDRRVADVTPTALEEFEHVLATTPYQKSGQPLHRSGREAAVGAIKRLVRWREEGGLERSKHTRTLAAAAGD